MADEEKNEEVLEEEGGGKSPVSKMLIIIIGLVIVVAISVISAYLMMKKTSDNKVKGNKNKVVNTEEKSDMKLVSWEMGKEADNYMLKKKPKSRRNHFVQCKLVLAYQEKNSKILSELEKKKNEIQDVAVRTFFNFTEDDIKDFERVKRSLKKNINDILTGNEPIKKIFFVKFMIQ